MITYIARNTLNGKFYIGSTTNFQDRKASHLRSQDEYPFQRALRRHPEAFEWETYTDDSSGREMEQALLDMFFGTEMCYNLTPNAIEPPRYEWTKERRKAAGDRARLFKKGKKESEETRRKKSESFTGLKKPNQTLAMTGRAWWVNPEGQRKFQRETPGPEWQNGRVYRP